MPTPLHLAAITGHSLTTTRSTSGALAASGQRGAAPALMCRLGLLRCEVTAIAGGATTVTWYLAEDADGDAPITPPVESTIEPSISAATNGGFAASIDENVCFDAAPSVYVIAKTDVGTATAAWQLSHVTGGL